MNIESGYLVGDAGPPLGHVGSVCRRNDLGLKTRRSILAQMAEDLFQSDGRLLVSF